jgi:hypothetical protein
MKRLPKIRDVIQQVKKAAESDEQIKLAAERPINTLSTDVGKSLLDFAHRIKTASVEAVTFEDVLDLGRRLTGKS